MTGPVASALGLTGAVSVNALTEDTAPDKAADFVCTYDLKSGGLGYLKAGTAATGASVFSIQKNGALS